jgi:hypothetical protein
MPTNGVRWVVQPQQPFEAFAHGGARPQNRNSNQSLTKARTQSGRATAF